MASMTMAMATVATNNPRHAPRKVVTIDSVLGAGLRVRNFYFNNIKLIEKK